MLVGICREINNSGFLRWSPIHSMYIYIYVYIYIHIYLHIYTYACGSRSQGPCKEFRIRRPSVLVEVAPRKIRDGVAKATFFSRESFA